MHDRTYCFLVVTLVTGFVGIASPAWGQVINEDLKLLASDGAANDNFGYSIAIDNGVIAIGASSDQDFGWASGSAYLFNASTGAQIAKLLPGDGAAGYHFGVSIAIDDGIVAIGAPGDRVNGPDSGSVYLFDASSGAQLAKLVPSDGAEGDWFGRTIAIDDGVVAIGAWFDDVNGPHSGSAYLFEAITGTEIAKLLPSDGAEEKAFSQSIAIDNGIVAIGAPGDRDNGPESGAAYIFDASTGIQIIKLLPKDGSRSDSFGDSIAIENGIVAVGAIGDSDNGENSGSAYVFNATTGSQLAKLLPDDGATWQLFGSSIAIEDGVVVVGAPWGNSAYLFDGSTGAQIAKLLPSDGAGQFGRSVAIDAGIVAIGAPRDNDNGFESGSAYVFDLCPSDFNDDGIVNTLDLIAYLNAYNVGDPRADMNGDGVVNTLDFVAFLNAYSEGC